MKIETLENYLEYVGRCRGAAFGARYRQQFRDTRGTAELGMLAAPSDEEYEQFCRVVAVMTEQEKSAAAALSDEQIREIARRAQADSGNTGIFLTGDALVRQQADRAE